MNIITILYS